MVRESSVVPDDPYPGVQQVFGDNLVASVVGLLEVAGENRVGLQERVEGVRHRVDVDGTADLRGEREIRLVDREHFLAVCQLSDHGSGKHF